ncbi:MAG: ABC transporter ATP-binding protein [Bacteroidales bacterium]|nr:ABC transporter ATP-binding protein [Bacteroidales bacterium]
MITLTNLQKQYSGVTVLDVPELTIHEGEIVGLVGNNGAGKTTMMRLMLDLIKANQGHVTIDGERVDLYPNWKTFTGSYLDSTFLVDFFTPEEFFAFIAETYGFSNDELQSRLQAYTPLMSDEILGKGKLIHDFSNGNRQKIGIIGAMLVNPRVLILDEPFNYLDPSSQIVVAQLIRRMNADLGTTVLVSSHNLTSINDLCNRILLLEKGKLLMDKPHEPGCRDAELEAYFMDALK